MVKELKNKPLVEAILELRWKLRGSPPGPRIDPHYKILLGRLFDRLRHDYPEHEPLPTANVPDGFVEHIVQHRFRVAEKAWPLVQVGPGILTVNSTAEYRWSDFRARLVTVVEKLYDAYPKASEFELVHLSLRYIDAIDFEYTLSNVFDFLKDKLKLHIALPDSLFDREDIDQKPGHLIWTSSFRCGKPKGMIAVRFATGQKNNNPAVVWETTIESSEEDIPKMPENFETWVDAAHDITDDWFFKMIAGDLERRFSGA